jgi:hypothetical protein
VALLDLLVWRNLIMRTIAMAVVKVMMMMVKISALPSRD